MRDYTHSWPGQVDVTTANLPTETIHDLLDYIKAGGKITFSNDENLESVIERLKLELDIRAWGL